MDEFHKKLSALRHDFHNLPGAPTGQVSTQIGQICASESLFEITITGRGGLNAIGDRQPMSFSEDFAHFTAAVPGCFLLLGNGETGPHGQPLHAADYDFNDALLPIGAAFWAELVRDRLPARKDIR
jgi:metal-dependent amidase/aminoacylase/carboxypeptidase family protein